VGHRLVPRELLTGSRSQPEGITAMPVTVTDFVTRACSRACHRHQAAADLHQAGHQFASAGARGVVLLIAVAGLVAVVIWRRFSRQAA
jgi:hypothetical protein